MGYLSVLFKSALADTLGVVWENPWQSTFAALVLFGLSLWRSSKRGGVAAVKEKLLRAWQGAELPLAALIVVFLLHLLVLTPKRLFEEQKAIAETVPELKEELERKTNGLDTNDPVFGNTIAVLNAFRVYRIGVGNGNKCVIFITSPASSMHIARMIAQFQITVSNCATFGPVEESLPSRQKENMEGATPGFLIINAPESDRAANALMDLSPNLPVRRGYKSIPEGRIAAEPFVSRPDRPTQNTIWLQFGENVRWGSQRLLR